VNERQRVNNGTGSVAPEAGPATDAWLRRLEGVLGDPDDPANPLGLTAVLAADERGELLAEGESALRGYGLNAEFVPAALGGRLTRADLLMYRLRAVFRRDCTLGIGYGVTSLIGSLPVWTSGAPQHRRQVADLLLGGGRVAAAYTELPHGADFTRTELAARPAGDSLVLAGRKDLINNVGRAEAVLVFARTGAAAGGRSHSHLLVEPELLPPGRCTRTRRYPISGVRGCQLGAIEFVDCPVPAGSVVGAAGGAMETVLRAFQVTRAVLPGMVLGGLDTQLRTVLRWALERRLYGRRLAELPHARQVLVAAFTDLLICDSMCTAVTRALHLLPEQTSGYAAAVKYLVPSLIQQASHELSLLLGARGYLREGGHAVFEKYQRDLPVVSLAHASSAVCLASILPQLPRWGRAPHRGDAPPGLFRPQAPLPELVPGRLGVTPRGVDNLCGTLLAAQAELHADAELGPLCAALVAELAALARRCAELPPREATVLAGRAGFELAARYAVLVAAACCLGGWLSGGPGGGFGRDPAWLVLALRRLTGRLGRPVPGEAAGPEAVLWQELTARYAQRRSFDLGATALAGPPPPGI
jgi:alkylation response protein AidB-like acyl-CoA dehydrogenase